ncbi:unnamed protein product [Closterium sp. Yama58-4]|nr:unnamed protein product [Closterium sp. Yama58-4]
MCAKRTVLVVACIITVRPSGPHRATRLLVRVGLREASVCAADPSTVNSLAAPRSTVRFSRVNPITPCLATPPRMVAAGMQAPTTPSAPEAGSPCRVCVGGGTSHRLQHHQSSQPPHPSVGSVAAALTPLLMDASGPPADSRDAEGEKAALHAAVPPMLSAEEDVEQPQRMQLFMAHLMAHLFCCGTLARPHCDIPAGPPEANDPSPPSRGFVPIDRSMPPIMSGRVLQLPASYLFSGGRPSEDDD